VFHCLPSTPAAVHSSQSRVRSRQPFTLAAGLWHLHWCRLEYAHSRPAGCRELFRNAETVAQHQAVSPASVYQSLVVALVLSRLDYGNITQIGIPEYQLRRLQSVINAAARLIAGLRLSDHITDTLASLHWLRCSSDHGVSPHRTYPLRSASSLQHDVPLTHRRAVSDRAFAAAGLTLVNSLPHDITDSESLTSFCRQPKTFLFSILLP